MVEFQGLAWDPNGLDFERAQRGEHPSTFDV
jgi:hypothetical protein